ncbi:zinc finger protein 277-like isoform X2 [Myxocyprinus asiaticus]|uniref:zinc finger protein 277-like isoform X2 n=1 Tax=Myxocyprinus asiaticus TaxID=70543 RepID=UPI0022232E31|nr:zinc finger protein 277-like isoform X2 [Myxocyprinus asiaticus]
MLGLYRLMAKEHSFSIGLPDNIVYCTEFLNTLERKLENDWSDLQAHTVCLFCEQQAETMEKMYTHMEETHEFDLHKLKTDLMSYICRELH